MNGRLSHPAILWEMIRNVIRDLLEGQAVKTSNNEGLQNGVGVEFGDATWAVLAAMVGRFNITLKRLFNVLFKGLFKQRGCGFTGPQNGSRQFLDLIDFLTHAPR